MPYPADRVGPLPDLTAAQADPAAAAQLLRRCLALSPVLAAAAYSAGALGRALDADPPLAAAPRARVPAP